MSSDFPKNWKSMRLEDAMSAIIDYRGRTPTKTLSGVPLVTAKIVKNGRILPADEFIAVSDFDSWMRRGIPLPNDIVVTTEAPLGEVAQLDGRKIALAQRLIALRGKPGILNNTFLKFLMMSPSVQDELRARSSGTTVLGIKQSELRKVTLRIPPLPEQKRIADILGSLDDKIELNRRTNETLEAMARAIFKSWFVDFDPVVTKSEGRKPEAMVAETAKLFPSSFEDSEIGMLPNGWKICNIGDCVTVVGGSTPSTGNPLFWNGTHCFCTPKDLSGLPSPVLLDTDRKITDEGINQISSGLLATGTVLLSSRAPIGYLVVTEVPTAINQGFIAMVCDKVLPNFYVLRWAEANMDLIKGRANGTTFMEVSKSAFRPIRIIVPSPDILTAFSKAVEPLHARVISNLKENACLANIRDNLLPRLLSGELAVPATKSAK